MDIITTQGLTKAYGATRVVDGLDLRVPQGSVFGFLGPNGSGKSTTMKMLLSLVRPTNGSIEVLGTPMGRGHGDGDRGTRRRVLGRIGSLIEAPSVYPHLTGNENMRIQQMILGLTEAQVRRALEIVRLDTAGQKLVKQYSLGMKQRLGIAMAIAHQPELLILDEPTNGLDPAGIEEIRELLLELAGEGVTIMVSSHQLAEIERMIDALAVIDHGRLMFQGTKAELFQQATPDLLITTDAGVVRRRDVPADATPYVVTELVRAGARIHEVRREQQTLEDIFIELTGRGGAL